MMKLKSILCIALSLLMLTLLLPEFSLASTNLPGGYRALVENERFIVGVNTSNCFFCIADKQLGEVFVSNPTNWKTDKKATGTNKTKLQSQMVVTILQSETENTVTVNSQAGSVSKGTVKLQKLDDGLRIIYTFADYGITVPLYVTISEECFRICVPADEIEETTADRLMDIELAPLLAATSSEDDGYILIPDGSGALIRFNNGKTKVGSYKAQVYGNDRTFASTVDNNTMLRAAFPVLGMNCSNYGLLAVATQGDAHAYVNAAVSGVTNNYNSMSFSFSVRSKGEYTIGEENYNSRTVNLYQQEKSTTGRYEVSFYPMAKENSDWISMARKYGEILFGDRQTETKSHVNLRLYGMIYKNKPVFGIPISTPVVLTPYEKAAQLLESLSQETIPAVLEYVNWNNNTARNRSGGVKASGNLGGNKAFKNLTDTAVSLGTELYFTTNMLSFSSENVLVRRFTDAATKLSSFPVELYTYAISTHKVLESIASDYVLKAEKVSEKGAELGKAYADLDINASYGDAAYLLYSDYTNANGNRAALMEAVVSLYKASENAMMSWPNAYALPYASYVTDVPMASSNLSLADETVPFYAQVLSGHTAFSCESVNLSDEPRTAFLYALETGADLSFTLATENTDELRFSNNSELYAISTSDWKDKIVSMYDELNDASKSKEGARVLSRSCDGNLVTLIYSNGTILLINYGNYSLETEHGTVNALDYLIIPGEEAAQ